jgi:predicted CXXCH cytochrome family protein
LRAKLLVSMLIVIASLGADAALGRAPLSPGQFSNIRLHEGGRPPRMQASSATAIVPDATPRYHIGSTLVCSDCHILHASQSHAYDPLQPAPSQTIPFPGPASAHLLRAGDPLDVCLACHDGQSFAPDVVGADCNGLNQRSAGQFGPPDQANPYGHALGRGLPPAPGQLCDRCHFSAGDQKKVTCVDCHDAHGNGVARNLQWASWPEGTPPLALFTNPAASGLSAYEEVNVSYGTLDASTLREVTNMCIDCHHVFTGGYYIDPDGDGIHNRHPSYESERGSANTIRQGEGRGTTDPAHWQGGTGSGFAGTTRVRPVVRGATTYSDGLAVDAARNGVFCLSCHRAHGSQNGFSLVWPAPQGVGPMGCDQCHNTAGAATGSPTSALEAPAPR